jgi:uncharacterized protein YyaL (SSP411 family)
MTRFSSALLWCLAWFVSPAALALENQLADNPSPYLAMHGEDPVHWQVWNAKTLERAKKEGKLLFVSSGYFACHWCHVMQRESYQNPVIAELLNTWFIPIKVDRELNPALDEHLIDFVQRTQGRAGWPLNVFLTPEGYPVVGMTYVPAERFRVLLGRLQKMWQADRVKVTELSGKALDELVSLRVKKPRDKSVSPEKLQAAFLESAMGIADDMAGGFGQQNRFPMSPQLSTLLEIQARSPDENLAHFLRLTLDQMADRGLRDHLTGGFFRYTVDPGWQTPHYEKMLYTQALLAPLYLRAAQVLKHPAYAEVAKDTLEFTLKRMCRQPTACVASFSAVDDQGVEGGYYLWNQPQLIKALPPELLLLAREHWSFKDLDKHPEGVLPVKGVSAEDLAKQRMLPVAQIQVQLSEAKKLLLEARRERNLPVDDKRLAGWNGLLLSALSRASLQLKHTGFKQSAQELRNYLVKELWDGKQLFRAVHGGQPIGQASIADYAYVAQGLRSWANLSNDVADRKLADQLLLIAWGKFHSADGWQSGSQALLPGMPTARAQDDGALPSAAALIMQLSYESENMQLRQRVQDVREETWLAIQDAPFWYASHVQGLLKMSAFKGVGK